MEWLEGWGVALSDEDGDGVFTGSLEIDPGTSFEYVVAVTEQLIVGLVGECSGLMVVQMQMHL